MARTCNIVMLQPISIPWAPMSYKVRVGQACRQSVDLELGLLIEL